MNTWTLFKLVILCPGLFFVKGFGPALFRILAWPPSRTRFDRIVAGKF